MPTQSLDSNQIANLFVSREGALRPTGRRDGESMTRLTAKQANWLFNVFDRETLRGGGQPMRSHGYKFASGSCDLGSWEVQELRYGSAMLTLRSHECLERAWEEYRH